MVTLATPVNKANLFTGFIMSKNEQWFHRIRTHPESSTESSIDRLWLWKKGYFCCAISSIGTRYSHSRQQKYPHRQSH